jgi:hypothetical protein
MNHWLKLSIQYANQRSYLDDLFSVYPTIPEGIRDIDEEVWSKVEKFFEEKENESLLRELLNFDLFPIKDSYVAYLKRDKSAIKRNPKTVNRLCGRLYEMGLPEIFKQCSKAKETNRQIGPMFKNWTKTKALGIEPVSVNVFMSNNDDAILDASDAQMMAFAKRHFNYQHDKGLDFIARFNGKYVIGEAKFLTDYGGHQNAQFRDAINTLNAEVESAIKIAILDGVLYIKGRSMMYKSITSQYSERNIMSALVLRNFLYSL